MTKLFLTCGLLAALTACATSQPAPMAAATPAAAAAPAATSAPAAQTATTVAAAPAKPKLVCEETEQMGSHFPVRVCMTPEQMEARRKAAQEAMRNAQMMGAQCAQGQNGSCGGPPR